MTTNREARIREVAANLLDRIGAQRLSADLVRGIVGEWERLAAPDHQAEAPSGPYMRPFHQTYPGLPELFHTYCPEHPDFGYCGTEKAAESAIASHLRQEHGRGSAARPVVDDAAGGTYVAEPMGKAMSQHLGLDWPDDAAVDRAIKSLRKSGHVVARRPMGAALRAALGGDQ